MGLISQQCLELSCSGRLLLWRKELDPGKAQEEAQFHLYLLL